MGQALGEHDERLSVAIERAVDASVGLCRWGARASYPVDLRRARAAPCACDARHDRGSSASSAAAPAD